MAGMEYAVWQVRVGFRHLLHSVTNVGNRLSGRSEVQAYAFGPGEIGQKPPLEPKEI